MIIATIVESISVDTIFQQNLAKETRAILNGCYSFAGQIGILTYSLVAGYLFDKVGPKSPFALIGLLDTVYALIIITAATCGVFEKHEDKSRKSVSKASKRFSYLNTSKVNDS